ncbi:MAG: glycogen/starch synthase, partial [Calditrichota bacterium]
MKILFLSSEITPFSCTGGLGDVAGALPKALKALGCEVRMVTPHYRIIRDRRYGLRDISRLRTLQFCLGSRVYNCAAKSGFLPGAKVQVYFIVADDLYNREGLYVDPQTGRDWPDNHIRFGLLSQASLQLMAHLQWMPDIIHCNDWQTALTVYLARRHSDYREELKHARLILQVHNLAFQGLFPLASAKDLGFCEDDILPGGIAEYYGQASLLKAGLYLADQIITVSPTYAREILESRESGCGLEGVLNQRREHVAGILNGVDEDHWNPAQDMRIANTYDS